MSQGAFQMHERHHFRLLATMNIKRIHQSSIVLTLLSLLMELAINQEWVEPDLHDLVFGVSLGLVLIALGINVKVIRSMGIPDKAKKRSQLVILLITLYAFAVYGLELI